MSIRLLFVEDDKAQLSLFQDALRDWNEANADRTFDLEVEGDFQSAVRQLDRTRFHAALLDLRLPGGDGKLAGGKLADICTATYGIPAAIISGHPADFDRKSTGRELLAVFDKGDANSYERAIEWFAGQWQMIDVLAATRSNIQSMGASVFIERVWPRWDSYANLADIDRAQLIGIVSRQYASHISEMLGLDVDSNIKWHPFENYVQPSMQEARPHTGDIFEFDDGLWVVLTPQCDMATGKAVSVLLAFCNPDALNEEWKAHLAGALPTASATAREKSRKFFTKLVNQSEPSQHFLPPLAEAPLLVEFRRLTAAPLAELHEKLPKRIASVAPPFLSNLTQRFGAYVSRIGQPNIDIDHFR